MIHPTKGWRNPFFLLNVEMENHPFHRFARVFREEQVIQASYMTMISQYPQEIEYIISKYPPGCKQSAVMPLLHLAQRETGYLTASALEEIASLLDLSLADVISVAGFYSLYHTEPGAKYRFQVCTDLPCALRGAEEFVETLCQNLGITVGETTPDGLITIEKVTCLAGCHHAPLFQLQSGEGIRYFENQTVDSALELVEQLRSKEQKAKA
jgi:NADH-quinone oxidoreductase E subunit